MRYTTRIVSASILLAALIAAACFATAAGSGRQELDQARAEAELGGIGVQTAMRIMLWTEPLESGAILLPRPTAEEKEHLARAEAGARAALSLEPDLVPALVLLGRLAWIGGRATEANNSYQRALLIAPDAGQALLGMADLQLDQRKPEKALSYLRGIRSTERGLADAVALRSGVISLMRGDARDALAAVAGAEPRTEAEELPYLWLIAKSCAISGESAVAEAVLARETPAWARPLWAEAHGLSMLAMGADGKALAELNRAAAASPAYALPRWERALILLNRNDAAGALKALAGEKPAAGALAGGSLFLLGTAREEAKDAAGAIRVYNELAGKRPRLGLAYYGLGRACYLAKRYSEALRHLTRGIKIAPDLPCLYLQRAEVYDKLKMRSQAKKDRKAAEAAAVPAESRGWRMEARSAAGDGASPAALVSISGSQTPHGLFVSVDGLKWRWHPWHGMPVPVPGAAIGGTVYAVPDDGVTGPLLATSVAPPASIDAQAPVFVRPAAVSREAEDPVLVWRTDEPTRAELSLWPAGGNARNSIMLRDDSFSPWHRLDLSDLMPGEYTLVLTIYDATGNSASSGQFNARIRHTGYTLEGGFTIESGAAWVNHRVVTLSFTLEGSQQGAMVRVANEGGLFTRWRALTPVLTWELSQGDGEKTVFVQFRRGAAMSPVYSGRVILDTRPPAIYGLLQPTVTDTGAVLTWRTDEETDARIDLQQGTGWAAVFVSPGFAEEHRAQLSGLAPGTRYILRITATDRAGNSSRLDRVELVTVAAPDRTPPEGWFQINGGAHFTNSVFVTLSIDGRDAESGVRSMSFSNDGLLWSLPEPFAHSKQWRLNPGDGPKLVYMRLVDGAGNISAPIIARITLDTTPPSIRDLAARLRADGRLEFSFRTDEPSYGLIQTGRTASFPQPTLDELRAGGLAREHSAIVTPPAGGGVFYYRAAACDQVGNTAVSAVESLVTREPDRNGPTGGIRIEDGALF
ncbi:MAG: tetratricopeptide repeat protein, partial [Patescibacteria group bacterium]